MSERSLSIIIPAYNEAENILDTLENVTQALAPLDLAHEILVIDDGSRDTTGAIVAAAAARFPNVRLLPTNATWGLAGRTAGASRRLRSPTS